MWLCLVWVVSAVGLGVDFELVVWLDVIWVVGCSVDVADLGWVCFGLCFCWLMLWFVFVGDLVLWHLWFAWNLVCVGLLGCGFAWFVGSICLMLYGVF